jgi:predicted O-methyltransferase YrrM
VEPVGLPGEEAPLEACRAAGFDALFERYISRIEGWLSKDEAAYLYQCARQASAGCVVEVGSYRGRSTAALGFGVNAGAGLPVYAVEPHEPFRGVFGGEFGPADRGYFMRTMAATGLYRHVRLVNVASQHLSDSWPTPVSLLFIDADHSYAAVKRDFECWRGKLAADARVVFDDATDPSDGPGRLVREIVDAGFLNLEGVVGKMACLRRVGG